MFFSSGFASALGRVGAALALLMGSAQAQTKPPAPTKTYSVTLDAEKDYFSPDTVKIVAVTRGGEVEVGAFDVTIRRTRDISVPGEASELVFRDANNVSARLKLPAATGKIVVRPLGDGSSAAGIGWMLGKRGAVTLKRLVVEFEK